MTPTLESGEYVLTEKLSYRVGSPQRGDIIVLKAPQNTQLGASGKNYLIKRIIGLPGEQIEIRDNRVLINGNKINENYIPDNSQMEGGNFALSSTQYFVMGDNRSESYDSRSWGPLERSLIVGKAFLVYWPLFRNANYKGVRIVKHEHYDVAKVEIFISSLLLR